MECWDDALGEYLGPAPAFALVDLIRLVRSRRVRAGRAFRCSRHDTFLFLFAFAQTRRSPADAVAQVIQFGAANLAGALLLNLGDLPRIEREGAFDAFALDDPAHSEHLAHPFPLARDHQAGEDLRAFFFAFENLLVDFDRVA